MTVTIDQETGLPVATLDDILSADDVKQTTLDVPEWGVRVIVRGLSRSQVLAWSDVEAASESDALLLQYGLVEPEVTVEQAREVIGSKSHAAVSRVLQEVMRLSGIGIRFQDKGSGD